MLMGEILSPGSYSLSLYALGPFMAGVLLVLMGILVPIRERASTVSLAFSNMVLSGSLWLLGYSVVYLSNQQATAFWWIKLTHLGVCLIPSGILLFATSIVGKIRDARYWIFGSFFLSLWFFVEGIVTGRLMSAPYHYFWGYYAHYTPYSAIFLAFFFAVLLIGWRLLWRAFKDAPSLTQKERLKMFLWAFGIAYLGAFDYLPTYGIEFYAFGYIPIFFFVAIAGWTISCYRLVDITPAFAAPQIIQAMADALLVFDLEGIIRVANWRAYQLFQPALKRLTGLPVSLISPELFPKEKLKSLLESNFIQNYEVNFAKSQHDIRTLQVTASLLRDKTKQPVGVVCVVRNITDLRRLEREQREQAEDILKKSVELARAGAEREYMELFAFAASHDLQEPLHKIIAFGDLLRKRLAEKLGETEKDFVERMQHAARHMSELLQALLQFSRSTTCSESLECVELDALIRDALTDLELKVAETKAEIKIGKLPTVMMNPAQIRQVFQNLLTNALKFHKPGEPPRVEISWAPSTNGFYEIAVRDQGVGFEQKYAGEIFKPFRRLHSSDEFEGNGMGLAICQKIVLHHGGRLTVKSEPGKGATFIVALSALKFIDAEAQEVGKKEVHPTRHG